MGAVEKTKDPGPVMDPENETEGRVPVRGDAEFKYEVIQQPCGAVALDNLGLWPPPGVGQPVSDSKTGFKKAVPGERMPPEQEKGVGFNMVLDSEMYPGFPDYS